MSARFRIRTPQGQELSFASVAMFADFVESGELSEGDLVYDASTGEWSPALTHSMVLEIQSGGAEEEAEASPETGGTEGDATSAAGRDGMGFDLAPEQTPEEASAAFVKEMEAERAAEFERSRDAQGLRAEDGSQGLLRDIQREPPRPPSPGGGEGSTVGTAAPADARRPDRAPPRRTRSERARDAGSRRNVSGRFVVWMLALGAIGAAGLLGPDIVALAMGTAERDDEVPGDAPVLPDTEEALRARADLRYLGAVRPRLLALPDIPSAWLDGHYLANASEYPGIGEVWIEYLATVRDIRSDENEIYSEAYLSALDDARVTGATRTLRLASALSRFEREGTERQAHFDRAEALALAAVDLHDFLLERQDRITYEPAVGLRVSVDPVLQAAGSDAETQQLLEAALDRVLDALSAEGRGPVEARALPGWAFEGLRETVAPE